MEGVVVGKGKLRLKGAASKRPRESKAAASSPKRAKGADSQAATTALPPAASATEAISIVNGTGGVRSSGNTVTGIGTSFRRQVRVGDGLRVVDPVSAAEEIRVVTMVVSDTSLAVSSAFPNALSSTTPFVLVRLPKARPAVSAPAEPSPKPEGEGPSRESLLEDRVKLGRDKHC